MFSLYLWAHNVAPRKSIPSGLASMPVILKGLIGWGECNGPAYDLYKVAFSPAAVKKRCSLWGMMLVIAATRLIYPEQISEIQQLFVIITTFVLYYQARYKV